MSDVQESSRQAIQAQWAAAGPLVATLLAIPHPAAAQLDSVMRDLLGRLAPPPAYAPPPPPPQYGYQPQYQPSRPPPPYAASPPRAPAPPAAVATDGRAVAEAQRLLTELGYEAGPADGAPGTRTVATVRAFQRDHGQAPTGEVGPATLAALRAAWHARTRAPAVAEAEGDPSAHPDLQGAKAFLTQVYAPHVSPGRTRGVDWTHWLDPSLASLLRRSQELTPQDEVPALNGDPTCGCQDSDFRTVDIATRAGTDGEMLGTASFVIFGEPRSIQYRLVRTRGAWRITDIMNANMPSLRQYLQDDIATRTASRAQRPMAAGAKYCVRDRGDLTTFMARAEPGGNLAFGVSTWTYRGSNFSVMGTALARADGWRFERTPDAPDSQERCVLNIARRPDGGYALSTETGARCEAQAGHGAVLEDTLTIPASTRAGTVTSELSGPEAFRRGECSARRGR